MSFAYGTYGSFGKFPRPGRHRPVPMGRMGPGARYRRAVEPGDFRRVRRLMGRQRPDVAVLCATRLLHDAMTRMGVEAVDFGVETPGRTPVYAVAAVGRDYVPMLKRSVAMTLTGRGVDHHFKPLRYAGGGTVQTPLGEAGRRARGGCDGF